MIRTCLIALTGLIAVLLLSSCAQTQTAFQDTLQDPPSPATAKNQPHLPPPPFSPIEPVQPVEPFAPVEPGDLTKRSCGGMMASPGPECGPNEYCHRTIAAQCGAADIAGVCKVKPTACDGDFSPVCGCDGVTYGNECTANTMGISAAYNGECSPVSDFCEDILAPVCGVDGQTYENACHARVAVAHAGACGT